MEASARMVRGVCQPKTKVTEGMSMVSFIFFEGWELEKKYMSKIKSFQRRPTQ